MDKDRWMLASSTTFRFFYIVGAATVLQIYLGRLGANSFQISLLEVAARTGMLVAAPVWGAISDITGSRKKLMMLSVLLSVAVIPIFGYTGSIALILFINFLMAVLSAGFPPIALAVTSMYGDTDHRGRNISVFNASKSAGLALARIAGGGFLTYLSFHQTFWSLGLVGLIALFLSTFIETGEKEGSSLKLQELWKNVKKRLIPIGDPTFLKKGLIFLYIGIFLRKAGLFGIFSLIAHYIVNVKGISEAVMGLLLGSNPLIQILFMIVFGVVVDRIGRRKTFSFGFLFSIPIPIIFAFSQTYIGFAVGFVLLGITFSALAAGSTAFIGDVSPKNREAELQGFRKTAQGFAGIIGPLAAGLTSLYLGFAGMFYTMAGLMTLGFLSAHFGTSESFDR